MGASPIPASKEIAVWACRHGTCPPNLQVLLCYFDTYFWLLRYS